MLFGKLLTSQETCLRIFRLHLYFSGQLVTVMSHDVHLAKCCVHRLRVFLFLSLWPTLTVSSCWRPSGTRVCPDGGNTTTSPRYDSHPASAHGRSRQQQSWNNVKRNIWDRKGISNSVYFINITISCNHIYLHFIRFIVALLITNDNISKKNPFRVTNNPAYAEFLVLAQSAYVIRLWHGYW